MLKMMIVDDDVLELESLAKYINWNMIDVTIVSTATNGMDALSKIVEHHPQILLSDIQMPLMDGLELARQANALDPSIKTILFSAFDEFEYARKALNMNVIGYVLKPIQTEELLFYVKQAVTQVNEEKLNKLMIAQLNADIRSKLAIMDDSAAHALLLWNDSRVKSYIKASEMKWMLSSDGYRTLVLLKCDSSQDGYHLISSASMIVSRDLFAARSLIRLSYTENALALQSETMPDAPAIEEEITLALHDGGQRICAAVAVAPAAEQSWNTLMRDVSERLNSKWERLLLTETEERKNGSDKSEMRLEADVQKLYLQLLNVFQAYEEQRMNDAIHEAYTDMFSYLTPYAKAYAILLSVESSASAVGADPLCDITACIGVRTSICKANSDEGKESILLSYASLTAARALKETMGERGENMNKVLSVIKSKFDAQLTVNDIARDMHYSPNYLGTVFRAKMNVGIGEYLTKYRLIKAMDMLANSAHSTVDIACLCGYQNVQYFYTSFKRNAGITPANFRKLLRGKD